MTHVCRSRPVFSTQAVGLRGSRGVIGTWLLTPEQAGRALAGNPVQITSFGVLLHTEDDDRQRFARFFRAHPNKIVCFAPSYWD
jgi:hypothetical protein